MLPTIATSQAPPRRDTSSFLLAKHAVDVSIVVPNSCAQQAGSSQMPTALPLIPLLISAFPYGLSILVFLYFSTLLL